MNLVLCLRGIETDQKQNVYAINKNVEVKVLSKALIVLKILKRMIVFIMKLLLKTRATIHFLPWGLPKLRSWMSKLNCQNPVIPG